MLKTLDRTCQGGRKSGRGARYWKHILQIELASKVTFSDIAAPVFGLDTSIICDSALVMRGSGSKHVSRAEEVSNRLWSTRDGPDILLRYGTDFTLVM